jgi:hypothetical protein
MSIRLSVQGNPFGSSIDSSEITDGTIVAADLNAALTSDLVHISGTETITGAKTFSATVTAPVGSGAASAPPLTFAGDTNTGLFRLAADRIGLAAGGTAVLDLSGVNGTMNMTAPSGQNIGLTLYGGVAYGSGGSQSLYLNDGSVPISAILNASGITYLDAYRGALTLRTGSAGSATTALTIDTSQNATFAGTITATGNTVFLGGSNQYIQNASGNVNIASLSSTGSLAFYGATFSVAPSGANDAQVDLQGGTSRKRVQLRSAASGMKLVNLDATGNFAFGDNSGNNWLVTDSSKSVFSVGNSGTINLANGGPTITFNTADTVVGIYSGTSGTYAGIEVWGNTLASGDYGSIRFGHNDSGTNKNTARILARRAAAGANYGDLLFQTFSAGSGTTVLTLAADQSAAFASSVVVGGSLRFNGTNSTGAGSAALGSNSPAVTNTAPYTWITAISSDGSTVYIPCWK